MAPSKNPTSFSPSRRWKIGFNVVVRNDPWFGGCGDGQIYLGGLFPGDFYLKVTDRVLNYPRTPPVFSIR